MITKLPARQLGQSRPGDANAVSIYAPASHNRTEIRKIVVCNTGSVSRTFRLFHDEDGTTYNETTALFWDIPIATGETVTITDEYWMDGAAAGNFAVRSSAANDLTFTLYGSEERIK
jgi:hypothetical protein